MDIWPQLRDIIVSRYITVFFDVISMFNFDRWNMNPALFVPCRTNIVGWSVSPT